MGGAVGAGVIVGLFVTELAEFVAVAWGEATIRGDGSDSGVAVAPAAP
ncbi:MAG: hypothetical protein M5U01_33815 [Ardenticatenaceae bacterium]|nr:hypothetical protein [Ardenticatenaceae bacterium]